MAFGIAASAAENELHSHRSQTPLTYIRDYAPGHLADESFFAAIAADAPELLVLGKDAPLHHNWGPVAGTGGENQSFGQGAAIRLLSPVELREKAGRIHTMVARLHASGVRWVMPYICTMTVGGDPERRTGLWEFYDHWDDYAAFGLGPRPQQDPRDWMQRTSDGGVRFYYPSESPRYAPNRRWAACIHHPGWRQHLRNVVRLAAEAGYDGVYMDNNRSTRCYCGYCQAAFRNYIAARLTPDEIRRDLGVRELKEVRLNPDADPFVLETLVTVDRPAEPLRLKPGVNLYHIKLTWEFWTDSKVELLKELKAIGTRARGAEFHIFANTTAYSKGAYEPGRVGMVASFNQSEENGAETGAHSGRVPPEIGDPIGITHNRRAFEYKFYQSLANGMRLGLLTRPGSGLPEATRAAIDENPQAAVLSMAESAAFGGGGGFKMDLKWDPQHAVRSWRAFFEQNANLYSGMDVWAPVGVIAFGEQFYCGLDKSHQEAVREISTQLLERGALFDLVHEGNFSLERLRRYRAVVVSRGVRSLSEAQLAIFRRYAEEHRGALLVLGDDFATLDEKCRPRPASQRAGLAATILPAAVSAPVLLEEIERALGGPFGALTTVAGQRTPAVGINAYAEPSAQSPRDLVVHVVNYDVPLGQARTESPNPVRDLVATMPLPPHWRVTSVKAFSPQPDEDLRVTFEVENGMLRLRIPRLVLYQIVRISGKP